MNISEKTKEYLDKRLLQCQRQLDKLRRKRKIIKNLYIVSILLSIIISSVVAVISTVSIVPMIAISVLSLVSAILTGISIRFNLHDKKAEIKGLIEKLNKIKAKLEFVLASNGDLTPSTYQQILTEF
jgi:fatty-acid desaturase